MPKPHTFPHLYNDALQIDLSKFKEWGYLEPNQTLGGVLTWSRNGIRTARITIRVDTHPEDPYLELDYTYGKTPRKYMVRLVSVPSNLGKGKVWYFLCPTTFKRCRKLYSIDGYFLHREAFHGCMYDSQIYSKKDRYLCRLFDRYHKVEEAYKELYSKHFKRHYAGRPTKRFLRLQRQIEQGEGICLDSLLMA